MAILYKVLGQVVPSTINTNTDLYTVPGGTSAVCSTLVICSQSGGASYSIAVRPGGESIDPKHWIVYNTALNPNDSAFLTLGLTLAPTDVVTVSSSSTSVSFSLFGSEIS
jgi:hypothetical protein